MIVVDVNVLTAAHLLDHVHHDEALRFLTGALEQDSVVVPDAVWTGFLRIVTNRRIFSTPSTMEAAVGFVRSVVSSAGYLQVAGLVDDIRPLLRSVIEAGVNGDLVPHAYIAAVAIAHGCPVATYDRDFRRFDGLRIVTPA